MIKLSTVEAGIKRELGGFTLQHLLASILSQEVNIVLLKVYASNGFSLRINFEQKLCDTLEQALRGEYRTLFSEEFLLLDCEGRSLNVLDQTETFKRKLHETLKQISRIKTAYHHKWVAVNKN